MEKPSASVQSRAINQITDTFKDYQDLSRQKREEFLDIYQEVETFQEAKRADWSVSNKVNWISSIVENVVPRVISRAPKYLVSKRMNSFDFQNQDPKLLDDMTTAMQDYLHTIFDLYDQTTQVEKCATMMAIYGTSLAKIDYRYETATITQKNGEKSEEITGEYPFLEPMSWTNIYLDPRYKDVDEMPAIIEVQDGVRFADLKRKEASGEFFNIDKIEGVASIDAFELNDDEFKRRIFEITGIQNITRKTAVDKNALNLKTYYGFFSTREDGSNERRYKITLVEDMIVIGFQEIDEYPFVDFRAFLDPEAFYAQGFAWRLVGLQRDENFKMNSANEMINLGLNRMWFWSPLSGVNPRDLQSRPGGIVPTKDTQLAQTQVVEIPFKQVPSDYFQNRNDRFRDFQFLTHTVDTSNPRNAQGLTNTATGARIAFFESNIVFDRLRRRFEKSLEKIAYKFIRTAFDNLENNIVIKKQGSEGFWNINAEAMRNAINRYDIKVEANSSSFDDVEGRREEMLALTNLGAQYAQAGVPVDFEKLWMETLDTFEKKDPERFIKTQIEAPLGQQPQQGIPGQVEMPPKSNSVADQTKAVAGGDLQL